MPKEYTEALLQRSTDTSDVESVVSRASEKTINEDNAHEDEENEEECVEKDAKESEDKANGKDGEENDVAEKEAKESEDKANGNEGAVEGSSKGAAEEKDEKSSDAAEKEDNKDGEPKEEDKQEKARRSDSDDENDEVFEPPKEAPRPETEVDDIGEREEGEGMEDEKEEEGDEKEAGNDAKKDDRDPIANAHRAAMKAKAEEEDGSDCSANSADSDGGSEATEGPEEGFDEDQSALKVGDLVVIEKIHTNLFRIKMHCDTKKECSVTQKRFPDLNNLWLFISSRIFLMVKF